MANARSSLAGSNTSGYTGTALAVSGGTPNTNSTEEFTGESSAINVKTLTQS